MDNTTRPNSDQRWATGQSVQQAEKACRILLVLGYALAAVFFMPTALADSAGINAFKENDLGKAKDLFKDALDQNNENVVALQYLAKIALRENDLDDAEDYIEKALELAPDDAEVQFDTANIMGAQAQDSSIFSAPGYAKKSLRAFERAAKLSPGTLRYRQGLMGFYLQAPGLFGGDDDLAMAEARAIAEMDEVEGFLSWALVYQSKGEEEKLNALYATADETFPGNPKILYQRGLYYQSKKRFDQALADFKKVQIIKVENDDYVTRFAALYQIGRNSVLGGSGRDEGIKALHTFIETAPEDDTLPSKSWAKYRLGLLYAKNGDKDTARRLYAEAKGDTKDKTLLKILKKELKKRG